MSMTPRQIRARLFLPVVRAGLLAEDWKWVLLLAFGGFIGPFLFWKLVSPISYFHVPIFIWIGFPMLIGSYCFFLYIRVGRKPMWFQHTVRSMLEDPRRRRWIPGDYETINFWLKEE